MTIEIRAVRADEMAAYRRISTYVFAEGERDAEDLRDDPMLPEWTTCAFVDGRLAAVSAAIPFTMRWNGSPVAVAGVTDVGTDPEFRRRGLLRRLIQQGFREQRERGQTVAILWASMGAIYQRYGYGLASTLARYDFDPRQAALVDGPPPTGAVRLTPLDEAEPDLRRAYATYAAPRTLALDRMDWAWRYLLRARTKEPRYVGIYRNGAGDPTGYVVYGTKELDRPLEPSPDQVMNVHEFLAADLDAFRGLWAYIRTHDLVERVQMRAAEDDPAPALMLEPRALRRRTMDAIWMRIVDVERALAQRRYAEAGTITFAVRDELCDWNDATFRLETDGNSAGVTRTSDGADITLPARSLAMLASGQYSASQLARWGQLEGRAPAALVTADRLFATEYRPYCPDGF
ncbi:MAG: GNAT family N-acetyltransferase [Chloroflexi bacterium]|nr:GNAT family N-acetyltransferase [Chloroflexota bacterium]MDA1004649.1 GNAT family N-acetyltransferase [Chloroflexota bacterium]